MLDERTLRRADFARGIPVRLADRQYWSFPTPDDLASQSLGSAQESEYQALTRSILESQTRGEMLQAELALTIFLLGCNYQLLPSTCFQMLCFNPADPALAEVQEALHGLAMEHVRARRTLIESRPVVESVRIRRPSFLRRFRASMTA